MIVCWAIYILNKTWPLLGKLVKKDENLTNQLRKYKRRVSLKDAGKIQRIEGQTKQLHW